MMNLYLIRRTDRVDRDEHDAFVIRAVSAARARFLADKEGLGYFKSDAVQIEKLAQNVEGEEAIVLGSFNAG